MTEFDAAYFDYAASAPPLPAALAAAEDAARRFPANPSARHTAAAAARGEWQRLAHRLPALLGCDDGRLIATASGTEANNLVLRGVLEQDPRARILVAADSHASVWFARELAPDRVGVLPLDATGDITPAALDRALTPDTRLVSLLHGSNETGWVQPVAALAAHCRRRRVALHLDGVQVVGHLAVNLATIPCDYYSFSAHKFGGPRGFGGLLARNPDLAPQLRGGSQEDGLRAGTENLPGLAGTVAALEEQLPQLPLESARQRTLAERLIERVRQALPEAICNSQPGEHLPGLVSLSFAGLDGARLVADLDLQGFAIATGSACHAQQHTPARALLARGRSRAEALGTVRISLGRHTTAAAVDGLIAALIATVQRHRADGSRTPR